MISHWKKRVLSLLLSVTLLLGNFPVTAFAEEVEPVCTGLVDCTAEIHNDGCEKAAADQAATEEAVATSGSCGQGVSWSYDHGTNTLTISGTGAMGDYYESRAPWYAYKDSIKMVVIESGVTSIGCNAFENCGNLTSITIPNSVRIIRSSAFYGCSSLANITIPDGVSSIEYNAFRDCSSLESITIPDSLTSIGISTFWGCSNLKDVYISNIEAWLTITLEGDYANPLLVSDKEHNLYLNGKLVKELVIPNSIASIRHDAFAGCDSLTSVVITDGVTGIGESAFMSCSNLSSITIPESVTEIDSFAFAWCDSLSEVNLPSGITKIEEHTFAYCESLEEITIPDGVTQIDTYAFYDCQKLKSISIPDNVKSIGDSAFTYCESLKVVVIPNEISKIPFQCFCNCYNLQSVSLPESIISIGEYAFSGCEVLSDINIPENVTEIAFCAFQNCYQLPSVTIPQGVTTIASGAFRNCESIETVTILGTVTAIEDAAFANCNSLEDVYFSGTSTEWTEMGEHRPDESDIYVHYECVDSTNHWMTDTKEPTCADTGYTREMCACGYIRNEVPKAATGEHTYVQEVVSDTYLVSAANCQSLAIYKKSCACGLASDKETFTNGDPNYANHNFVSGVCAYCALPEGLVYTVIDGEVTITDYTGSATDLVIPETIEGNPVKIIGKQAFYYCESLTSISIPASVVNIGGEQDLLQVFAYCSNLSGIWVDEANSAYSSDSRGVLYNKDKTILLTAPGAIFGDYTIPDGVTTIGDLAFVECNSLESIAIPDTVTSIGAIVFSGCSSLEAVDIPNSVTSLGGMAFMNCKSLKEITLSDKLTIIESYTFAGCENLTEISIPDSVTDIDEFAFRGCSSLTSFEIPYGVTEIWGTFTDCSSLTEISIPESVVFIQLNSFENCSSLKHVTIPKGVKEIGPWAFRGCTSLTSITISDSVTWLSQNAFENCIGLKEIFFEGDLPQDFAINGDSFTGVTATVYYPRNNPTWTADVMQNYGGTLTWKPYCVKHSYSSTTTDPTCTGQGYTTHTCACGDSYIGDYVNANGHSYGSWYTITAPGCSAEGVQRQDCNNCDYYETKVISANGHSYNTSITEPTCESQGYTTYTCACGHSYTDNYTEKIAHVYTDGVCSCGQLEATTLSVTNVASSGKIKLSWTKNASAEKYQVYRSADNKNWKRIKTTTDTSYTDTSAEIGTTYCYKVKIIVGDSSIYTSVKTGTCDLASPNLSSSNTESSGKIKLSWDKIEGAFKYQVYRSADNKSWKRIKTTTGVSYTDSSAEAGTMYYYKVKAMAENTDWNSAYSEVEKRTCDLARPTLTVSNVASSGKIKLSWDKIGGAIQYQVYRSADNKNWKRIKTTTSTSYTDSSAEAGTTYYYKVRAIAGKSAANSAYSKAQKRTCDLARPSISVVLNSSGQSKVKWGAVKDAVKYTVYRKASGESSYTKIKTTTSKSYTDKTAKEGVKYYYKVKAICSNSTANSAYSNVVSVKEK